jgi:hypothetical protein
VSRRRLTGIGLAFELLVIGLLMSAIRRTLFLFDVNRAEAEFDAGQARAFEGMEQLLDELRA